jgi:hypothetical protein
VRYDPYMGRSALALLLYKMLAFVSTLVLHFSIPPGCNKHTNINTTNFVLFLYMSLILI